MDQCVVTRVVNRIFFHFPVSEGYNRVDNRIANIVKIIGYGIGLNNMKLFVDKKVSQIKEIFALKVKILDTGPMLIP